MQVLNTGNIFIYVARARETAKLLRVLLYGGIHRRFRFSDLACITIFLKVSVGHTLTQKLLLTGVSEFLEPES